MNIPLPANRNDNFDRFVTLYFDQGFSQLSLEELFCDVQPNESLGHLQLMMKSKISEHKDRIQKSRFYLQCTQGSTHLDDLFHVKTVQERVLNFFAEEACFSKEEYPYIELIVDKLQQNNDIGVLEFMGYKKGKGKDDNSAVLLGVCIFALTQTCGCCILYLASK